MKYILNRAYRVARTDFVKVSIWSGLGTVIKMLSSFISIKVVSRIIGPPGIALVGQFMNSITMLSALGTGCIGQGVTKYIAQYHDGADKQQRVIGNAAFITLLCTIITSLGIIIFERPLGLYIFKTHKYDNLIVLFGISLILYTFNTLLINILNGFKAFRKFVIANIVSSLFVLLLSVLLVMYFGLYGALLNCIVSQSAVLFVTLFFVYREPWFRALFRNLIVNVAVMKQLSGFTLMMLTSSLLVPFTQITIRNYITTYLSLHSAGLWEAMNRISGMYLLVITTSISTYYLPRLSEIKDATLLKAEVLKTGKIVLPLLAVSCFCIYLCRELVVRILFSPDFLPMQNLFAPQMIGDFFKIASWMLAYLFWAKAMIRQFIIAEVVFNLLFIFFAMRGVKLLGLPGSAIAYALNYMLYFTVLVIFFNTQLNRQATV